MNLPVRSVNRPSDLDGQLNGRIAPDRLISVDTNGSVATLVRPAAAAWVALCAAAKADGHILLPFSSYRSYEKQKALFLARYSTAYKAGVDRKVWEGKTWYKHTGATTAAPGTSNHGWGLAVDVRVKRNGSSIPIDDAAVAWLVENEERFGFSHEIQSEPWHIRYWAGDTRSGTTPAPDLEDDVLTNAQDLALQESVTRLRNIESTLGWFAPILKRLDATDDVVLDVATKALAITGGSPTVDDLAAALKQVFAELGSQ
jgi:LAS superfamily LD-carboxypeptidase LdcB